MGSGQAQGNGRLTIASWHKIAKETFKMDTVGFGLSKVSCALSLVAKPSETARLCVVNLKHICTHFRFTRRDEARWRHFLPRFPDVRFPSQGYAQLVFEIFFDCQDPDATQGSGETTPEISDVNATEFAVYLFLLATYKSVPLGCLPTLFSKS